MSEALNGAQFGLMMLGGAISVELGAIGQETFEGAALRAAPVARAISPKGLSGADRSQEPFG